MPAKKRFKILVVENETFLVKIFDTKLKKEGFDVVLATDGEQAVDKAASEKPDLILLDLLLPKMRGFEALEKIRQNPDTASTRVIILTNLGQEVDIQRAKSLGALDFLVKTHVPTQEVVDKIRRALDSDTIPN